MKLRVGIDQFHVAKENYDGSETPYVATRMLPGQYGSAVLLTDPVLERLLPPEERPISPESITRLGWRCLWADRVNGAFMDKDAWRMGVKARAVGTLIAMGNPYPGTNGGRLMQMLPLSNIRDIEGRPVPVYTAANGEEVPVPKSQLYVPLRAEFLPDVARQQFTRR